jgi:ribosome biogenesis GTPase A
MAIQWFPGHMNKASRILTECVAQVDGVFEIVDARAPLSSRNPLLNQIIGDKPRLILLNKSDLADSHLQKLWLSYFKDNQLPAVPIAAKNRLNIDRLKSEAQAFMKKRKNSLRERVPKVLIVGVPNCGKSTLINALARQKKAMVADKPGVTRETLLYKIGSYDLYDSPGTLWPNLEDQEAAARLALLGSVRDEVFLASEALELLYPYLSQNYAQGFVNRYNLKPSGNYSDYLENVAAKAGRSDLEDGAKIIIKDLRTGRLGNITLEKPPIN